VLAYRLLSGEFPFPGPGSNDFLKQHITMAPKPLTEAVPALSHAPLAALVMQCLEKDAAARPQNALALYEKLIGMMPANPYESSVTTPSRRVLVPVMATPPPQPASQPPASPAVVAPAAAQPPLPVQPTAPAKTRPLLVLKAQAKAGQLLARLSRALRAARNVPDEWRKSLLAVAGLCLLAPAVWAMLPASPSERAAKLLTEGRGEAALSLLDKKLQDATYEAPELFALKAASLHQLKRESDERDVLRTNPYQALHAAHPLLLDSLAEDFARAEDDVELGALIKLVPHELLEPHFDARSRENGGERQWGALRWLDIAGKKELGPRYIASLQAPDCYIRAAAAKRLADLHVGSAIESLRVLSETPKERSEHGLLDCGQDDAADAIRELKRQQ
jgi:hypothetical protein